MERIFVKVLGFTDTERHALNAIFRLSQDSSSGRSTSFEPWMTGAPSEPRIALIDSAHPDAGDALQAMTQDESLRIIWVGSITPARATAVLQRPLHWPQVLATLEAASGK